ncbi:cation diffusion facilitator family transporter [Methanobrevibacter sp.]|uniref:cation diffusion facilitator family transporter n=1 Tax=Methanobrevibacter sp. TaxID=66852 RepID=UPI00388E0401
MDEIRQKGGKKAATVAIIANVFLTIFNVIVGMISGSYALISEGAHTLSDVTTSIIAYIGFYYGQKPADDEHPLGHGRAEAISGLIIVIFLFLVGWEIFRGALFKILNPATITVPNTLAAVMAVIGILVNLSVSSYIINIGKQIRSPALVADGQHQRTDVFSSVAILIGVIVSNVGFPILDPIVGLIIALLIFKTAAEILIENINNIMGKLPSKEFIEEIEKVANSCPQVEHAHEIKVDYLGTYATVSLHVELDGNMTLDQSHKIAHQVQNKIVEEIPEIKYVNVHTCPIGSDYNHKQKLDK